MKDRLSCGKRRHIREVKTKVRDDLNSFLEVEDKAMADLRKMVGELPAEQIELLRKWWQIRNQFDLDHNEDVFKQARREFLAKMDGIESQDFSTAIRFITESFTKPGR